MYNVRYFEYENSLQFRIYTNDVRSLKDEVRTGVDIFGGRLVYDFGHNKVDCITGEVVWSDIDYVYGNDWVYASDEFEFDMLEVSMNEEIKRKHEDSIRSSVGRTKRNIVYLSRSNSWEWFVTFTLNPEKVDRYDYVESSKKVRKFLNNLRRLAPDMVYLIVPELHQDGAWHYHGLMSGIDSLDMVDSGVKDSKGRAIYNMSAYKLGYSTCSRIGESDAAANYVMKYITKELCEGTKGRQRYWTSNNIKRANVYQADIHGEEYKKLIDMLYENTTWKKKIYNAFVDVEIFEVPKDFVEKYMEELNNGNYDDD